MAKKPKRQPDAARKAKLTIQRRTLYLLMVFGVFSFLALFAKAYDLTINQHEEMQERASSQQTQSTTISASRGTIYDRNGETLAISATADTVFLDPKMIQERADELDQERAKALVEGVEDGESLPITGEEYKDLIATELSRILEIEEDTIREKMEKTWSQYEILKKRVDKEIGDEVRAFITDNITGKNIQGIHLLSDAKRYYPHSTLASHVLGFLNNDNVGIYGLEAYYETELEGTTGLVVTARDGNNQEIMFQYEQYYDAEDGNSLQLTIDSTIQSYLESGLEDMIARFDAANGATGIVMDPNSGAILAMASSPNYDLNDPWGIYDTQLQAQLDELLTGGSTEETDGETEESAEEESQPSTDPNAANEPQEPDTFWDFRTHSLEKVTVTTDTDYEADCAQARSLLAQAGYPNGTDFPAVEYIYVSSDAGKAAAQAVAAMWKDQLGITVTTRAVTADEYETMLTSAGTENAGDSSEETAQASFQIAAQEFTAAYNDAKAILKDFFSSNATNLSGYDSDAFDILMKSAAAAIAPEARDAYLHDAEAILLADAPVIPLYYEGLSWQLREGLSGLYRAPDGVFFLSALSQNGTAA